MLIITQDIIQITDHISQILKSVAIYKTTCPYVQSHKQMIDEILMIRWVILFFRFFSLFFFFRNVISFFKINFPQETNGRKQGKLIYRICITKNLKIC